MADKSGYLKLNGDIFLPKSFTKLIYDEETGERLDNILNTKIEADENISPEDVDLPGINADSLGGHLPEYYAKNENQDYTTDAKSTAGAINELKATADETNNKLNKYAATTLFGATVTRVGNIVTINGNITVPQGTYAGYSLVNIATFTSDFLPKRTQERAYAKIYSISDSNEYRFGLDIKSTGEVSLFSATTASYTFTTDYYFSVSLTYAAA